MTHLLKLGAEVLGLGAVLIATIPCRRRRRLGTGTGTGGGGLRRESLPGTGPRPGTQASSASGDGPDDWDASLAALLAAEPQP